MNEVARTEGRRKMEQLYEEQIRKARHRAEDLETDLHMLLQIAEQHLPVDAYEGTDPSMKVIINALLTGRTSAAAWKLKAGEAVHSAKVERAFADTCIDRLSKVVQYATANYQPLDKHRADLVEICNVRKPEEENTNEN